MTAEYKSTVPFTKVEVVVPHDSTDLARPARSLYIGVAGDVSVETIKGDTAIFKNHPVGYMPGQITRVNATGTAATDMIALI